MTTLYQDNKFKQTLLVTSLAAIFSSSTAFSQAQSTNEDINSLDMISVIGQATSGLDDVVSSEELEKVQANDLSDIFRKNPTVSVGGSVKSGQKIYVRNVGEDALNVSVDGAELAGAVFHHAGRVTVDPELLKRVEIEAGAGSATAGPGAIGGAVRFITKDPEDLLKEGESVGAIVKGSYFSNGDNANSVAFSDREYEVGKLEREDEFELSTTRDSIVVTLTNISRAYFEYIEARNRSGNSFLSEPISFPSNITNGYGFFNIHFPSARILELEN